MIRYLPFFYDDIMKIKGRVCNEITGILFNDVVLCSEIMVGVVNRLVQKANVYHEEQMKR